MSYTIVFGDMKALTNSQRIHYINAQSTFFRIQDYNRYVRGQRIAGNKTLAYYVFKEGEQGLYTLGQRLLYQNDTVGATQGRYNSITYDYKDPYEQPPDPTKLSF